MRGFGKPKLAMVLSLDKRDKLANADINKVKQGLSDNGYYLQIPPPVKNLLNIHREQGKQRLIRIHL